MDIPWQLCRTIGPLLSQRFPLASATAQPRGGGFFSRLSHVLVDAIGPNIKSCVLQVRKITIQGQQIVQQPQQPAVGAQPQAQQQVRIVNPAAAGQPPAGGVAPTPAVNPLQPQQPRLPAVTAVQPNTQPQPKKGLSLTVSLILHLDELFPHFMFL